MKFLRFPKFENYKVAKRLFYVFKISDPRRTILENFEESEQCAFVQTGVFNLLFTCALSLQNPNSLETSNLDEKVLGNVRHFRRILLMFRVLISICGQAVRNRFSAQQLLVKVGVTGDWDFGVESKKRSPVNERYDLIRLCVCVDPVRRSGEREKR